MSMHPLIINGLSSIGVPLLEQTLGQIRNEEHIIFNFKAIMQRLSRKGCALEIIRRMKSELLESIRQDPLLNEFRTSSLSKLSIKMDTQDRCVFKENDEAILICSRDSNLGKMGIAYYNLSQLETSGPKQKEVYLETVA